MYFTQFDAVQYLYVSLLAESWLDVPVLKVLSNIADCSCASNDAAGNYIKRIACHDQSLELYSIGRRLVVSQQTSWSCCTIFINVYHGHESSEVIYGRWLISTGFSRWLASVVVAIQTDLMVVACKSIIVSGFRYQASILHLSISQCVTLLGFQ